MLGSTLKNFYEVLDMKKSLYLLMAVVLIVSAAFIVPHPI